MTNDRTSQNGSAFFIILVAIMMFAMLSYAVSQGSRSSASSLTAEQSKLLAQEIIDYFSTLQKAVQTLKLRGCSNDQISFHSTAETWYNTPTAPANESCHVFSLAGGKVNFKMIPKQALYNEGDYPGIWFNGQSAIEGIGSSEPELLAWSPVLKPEVCVAINQILYARMLDEPEIVGAHDTAFDGTYNIVANGLGDDIPNSVYAGKSTFCSYDSLAAPPTGNYVATLIVR